MLKTLAFLREIKVCSSVLGTLRGSRGHRRKCFLFNPNYSNGWMVFFTQNTKYFIGGMIINTKDTNYSI